MKLIEKKNNRTIINDVRTYLAIKYGIDLIDYKQYGYFGKKWWDGSDKLFNHNIFGLAKMEYYNLNNYKTIHSKDQDLLVYNSGSRKYALKEGDYILFGNNKKTLSFNKKTKLSYKQWLAQTNLPRVEVDLIFPISKLKQTQNSFVEYMLLVGDKGNSTNYKGTIKDSLLIFKKVALLNTQQNIIKLKEFKSDLKFDVESNCESFQLKVETPPNTTNYSIKILNDKGDHVLSSVNSKETYKIKNEGAAYFNIYISYNGKIVNHRVDTPYSVLNPKELNNHYTLFDQESVTIQLKDVADCTYQWFFNNQEIGTGNRITLNKEGNYSVKITQGEDCTLTKTFTVSNDFYDGGWRLYPNPAYANEDINVMFQLSEPTDVKIAIYNNSGKLVKTAEVGKVQSQTYNLGALSLASGAYIVVAYFNEIPHIKKIIIK